MVCVGFLGVALCRLQDKHIKIEILVIYFRKKSKNCPQPILVAGLCIYKLEELNRSNEYT